MATYDCGGYVTKNDVLCVDGRRIKRNAFKIQNGTQVPVVWMHQRNEPENVLGHAILENRDDGVYGYLKFNSSPRGKQAKLLVEHGDINAMSIFANQLVQKGADVTHGMIREVSLVIAPANPGALIDNPVAIQHSDTGDEEYEDLSQAIIHSGCYISLDDVEFESVEHSEPTPKKKKPATKKPPVDDPDDEHEEDPDDVDDTDEDDNDDEEDTTMDPKKNSKSMQHAEADDDEETVQDVYDSMTDKQKKVVAYMIGAALSAEHGEDYDEDEDLEHYDMEGDDSMSRNVFDQNNTLEMADKTPSLSHDQINTIFEDARKCGSLKESVLEHAGEYGITNIDILFPDAKAVTNEPHMIKRDTEWVAVVLSETNHVPFSRVKTTVADITADEARARGYVKGTLKKEEVIKLLKRAVTPTTIYKKQKLDRDDLLEITDFNVVAWLKAEMRVMLNEELARAILVSDGREADDPDKINEDNIKPIWKDDDMYAHHVILPASVTDEELPEQMLLALEEYKGSGSPGLYTTSNLQLKMLLIKDKIGRRLYNTVSELAAAIDATKIVKVPVMQNLTRTTSDGKTVKLLGIYVNLRDYTTGSNAGGQISFFEDFDIDYNQQKYLLETRCSGMLTVPKSAIVIEQEVVTSASSSEEIG